MLLVAALMSCSLLASCAKVETSSSEIEEIHGIDPQVEQGTAKLEGTGDASIPQASPEIEQRNINVSALAASTYASQIITVYVNPDGTAGLAMYARAKDGNWVKSLPDTRAYIGKDGIGEASEAASVTPQGTFPLTSVFGIAPDPGASLPYTQVDDTMYWVSDATSVYYNQMVSTIYAEDFDIEISEHLIEVWPDYEYAIVMGCNPERIPGAGSAFFIHCKGEDDFTEGCVSADRDTVKRLVQDIGGNAVVVIDYADNFQFL